MAEHVLGICRLHEQIRPGTHCRIKSKTSETSANQLGPREDRGRADSTRRGALALFLFSCLTASVCHAQSRDVVCRAGVGYFEAEFHTGVKVHVGASRIGELEARVCEAGLSWGDENLVVSDAASDLDIDAFGVDLGLGAPVAGVQAEEIEGRLLHGIQNLFPATTARAAP